MNSAPQARLRLSAKMWPSSARLFERARSAFFLFALALLTGCFRHEPRADLTIINNAEPESLDPAVVTSQPDMRLVPGLFEGLTRADPVTGGPVAGLAERWEVD